MNEQFTPELLEKARAAETPEALLALAAEAGVTLTPEEAQAHFDLFHQTGELADEELDNVSGGKGCYHGGKMVVTAPLICGKPTEWKCKQCGGAAHWDYDYYEASSMDYMHYCPDGKNRRLDCAHCGHAVYEDALLLCNNPNAYC